MRTIITGRHRKPTGLYASAKTARSHPWEDRRERFQFWLCEADPKVASFLAQPHRLDIWVGGPQPLTCFPDLQIDYADGAVEFVEIKKRYDPEPDYAAKLELARTIYVGLGWGFRIVTERELLSGRTLANAQRIQRDRHSQVSVSQTFAAMDLIEASRGNAPYGQVQEALGGGPVGAACLHALIVRRVLSLDLGAALNADTPISLVDRLAEAARPIVQER